MGNNEVWKAVPGFKGIYEVSNMGRIRSVDRYLLRRASNRMGECWFYCKGVIKSQRKTKKCQYLSVDICNKRGGNMTIMTHRLVAKVFVKNPQNKPCVNHKDANKLNNKADNLEWCTYKENSQHAKEMGLLKR